MPSVWIQLRYFDVINRPRLRRIFVSGRLISRGAKLFYVTIEIVGSGTKRQVRLVYLFRQTTSVLLINYTVLFNNCSQVFRNISRDYEFILLNIIRLVGVVIYLIYEEIFSRYFILEVGLYRAMSFFPNAGLKSYFLIIPSCKALL